MKRLIRIIFLLVLIQHIITEPLCTEDGAGCYSVDVPPSKFCARFGDYCKVVPYCELASENEKECKLYPVVVGANRQGCFPNDNGGCVMRPLCHYAQQTINPQPMKNAENILFLLIR